MRCLRTKDATELLSLTPATASFGPVVDGVELTDEPWTLLAEGKVSPGVPVIAGSVSEDGGGFVSSAATEAEFRSWLLSDDMMAGNKTLVDRIVELYAPEAERGAGDAYSKWWWAAKHVLADSEMACPARRTARAFEAAGVESFHYIFGAWPSAVEAAAPGSGASHSSDIPFVFDVTSSSEATMSVHGPAERELAALMASFWHSFAKTGRPGAQRQGAKTVRWPPFNATTGGTTLILNTTTVSGGKGGGSGPHSRIRQHPCESLWNHIIEKAPII